VGRNAVCNKCSAIDRELVTFQRLWATIEDQFTLALMAEVVKDLQSERAALHDDDENNGPE
jgi:hypothetical protein